MNDVDRIIRALRGVPQAVAEMGEQANRAAAQLAKFAATWNGRETVCVTGADGRTRLVAMSAPRRSVR